LVSSVLGSAFRGNAISNLRVLKFEMGMFKIGMTFLATLIWSNEHIFGLSKQL
jgi:hypothetical protein